MGWSCWHLVVRCREPIGRTAVLVGIDRIGAVAVAGRSVVVLDRMVVVAGCCSRKVVAGSAGSHRAPVHHSSDLDRHSWVVAGHRSRRSLLVLRSPVVVVLRILLAVLRIPLEGRRSLLVVRSRRVVGLGSTSLTCRRDVKV